MHVPVNVHVHCCMCSQITIRDGEPIEEEEPQSQNSLRRTEPKESHIQPSFPPTFRWHEPVYHVLLVVGGFVRAREMDGNREGEDGERGRERKRKGGGHDVLGRESVHVLPSWMRMLRSVTSR